MRFGGEKDRVSNPPAWPKEVYFFPCPRLVEETMSTILATILPFIGWGVLPNVRRPLNCGVTVYPGNRRC